MSLGKEMMSHLCQRLSTLTSREFIRAPDPTVSVQRSPVCSLSSTELGSCPGAHCLAPSRGQDGLIP